MPSTSETEKSRALVQLRARKQEAADQDDWTRPLCDGCNLCLTGVKGITVQPRPYSVYCSACQDMVDKGWLPDKNRYCEWPLFLSDEQLADIPGLTVLALFWLTAHSELIVEAQSYNDGNVAVFDGAADCVTRDWLANHSDAPSASQLAMALFRAAHQLGILSVVPE